ncbi:hypothetical protein JD844_018806 [Phrynosoma platyrhinos]|uniref:SCP domain-containing protein n=1 Tax=Phrynosoma platyrhinos TaxID=52577 RepID=A0ABQ7SP45_PHRPL|nr:hypothetical protein JD844_018806 [Phrynosoma platyrhinos]
MLPNATGLLYPSRSTEAGLTSSLGVPRTRRKRYISPRDMSTLLDYHNQVWDERLARSAKAWAKQCIWEHGPPHLMKYIGQNLAIHSGR